MKVALLSAFRDSEKTLSPYCAQVAALERLLNARGDTLHLVWGEGDSKDATRAILEDWTPEALVDVTHGGVYHGSVIHPERGTQLSFVWNKLIDAIPDDVDVVLTVESDLVWQAQDLLTLIDQTADYPIVCGMVWHRIPAAGFYDTWAYRIGGKQFAYRAPFHPALASAEPGAMVQLDSAGSLLAMRAEYAQTCRIDAPDVVVEFCRQAYALGGSVWLNPAINIYHP